jgi:hypothetical protein
MKQNSALMNKSDIDLMLAEKGSPCLSIVIPTQRYTKGRMQNSALIEKALLKAKKLLANGAWPTDKIKLLESKLDSMLAGLDYLRLQEGLAIFISPNISRIFLLPFLVKEKVMVGKTFEVRDLFYFSQILKPYYLLTISKKRVRLFKGCGRDLQEIANNDFPKQYVEEYEYAHASVASSSSTGLKAFERDKSIMQETRMRGFFKQADHALDKYLKGDMLLFVAGVWEELTSFEQISDHVKRFAGKIPGNYDIDAVHPLAESVWKQIKNDVKASHTKLLVRLEEEIGKELATDGITNVWKAANEGKGLTLLLEKDYQVTAYQDALNVSQIYLTPPTKPYNIILDASDDVIEIVKEKGGDIVIVENGQLTKYNHIAMLLRYK